MHSLTQYACNCSIDLTALHRDLGDLTWNNYYSAIILGAQHACNSHSLLTKLSMYKFVIRPKILFCYQIWHHHELNDTFSKVPLNSFCETINKHCFYLFLWIEYLDLTFLLKMLSRPSDHFSFDLSNLSLFFCLKT